MPAIPTESTFELTTIERLKKLGYRYQHGGEIERDLHAVVLEEPLRTQLSRRYRHLPAAAIEQAIQVISTPEGATLDRRNMAFQKLLREGITLRYEVDGEERFEHIYFLDYDRPELNDFLVVNQLTIHGGSASSPGNTRRPDVVVYVNGLPLVVFELKSPWDEYADVVGAHHQLGHYTVDIPQLFNINTLCVVSDGNTTLHGLHAAGFEWFAPWKSIDGLTVEPNTTGSMKTLVEGLFPKERLLDYVRNFIVHEVVNEKITKKGAKYHQYFAVRFAVGKTLEAMQPGSDKRVGVVWHTQGSGKSLSMIFLTGILRRWPGLNPTVVVQVDRTDLDNQLYDNFVAAKDLVGTVHQADSVEALRERLQTAGGEVICSTIEKFRLQKKQGELRHPVLSARHNVLVIADEAHRTQYNLVDGFGYHLREALPNASFIAFTGTPIDKEDANTVQLFGDTLHVYDMQQAKEDNAVVGIFYEARHIPLDLANQKIDADLEEIAEEQETVIEADKLEQAKAKWAAIERAAGTRERVDVLARDLLAHYSERQKGLQGKAMVVCMSRRNCVTLYNALKALPGCPEIRIVMTGNLAEDPKAWSEAGHITTKGQRESIKARFVDPDDPLQIVIVRDMWLTGFDAPCVNTLYVDKPMKGHNLMQAIARVNRIFKDKPGGLIVDYIGIADELKEATRKYTSGGGRGSLTEDLTRKALATFLHQLEVARACLPPQQPYNRWRDLDLIELEDLTNLCYGTLADEQLREDFLTEEHRLSKGYSLVMHVPTARAHAEEVAFCQMIRKQLQKLDPKVKQGLETLDRAVRDLLDESISAQPAVDIFAVAGLDKPDISILDEKFLAGFKQQRQQDLQARLLERLMRDELEVGRRRNLARYRSFRQMLDEAITRYNNRTIQAADVVAVMVEIRQQQLEDERRKQALGLNDEELAFYDVVALSAEVVPPHDDEWIAGLVREATASIKTNLKVDWTRAHQSAVYASVQSAVGRVLRRRGIRGEAFEFLRRRLMVQAEAMYEEWPMVA